MNVQQHITELLAAGRHVVVESTLRLDRQTDAILGSTEAILSHFATLGEALSVARQFVPDSMTSFYVLDPQPVVETPEFNLF